MSGFDTVHLHVLSMFVFIPLVFYFYGAASWRILIVRKIYAAWETGHWGWRMEPK